MLVDLSDKDCYDGCRNEQSDKIMEPASFGRGRQVITMVSAGSWG